MTTKTLPANKHIRIPYRPLGQWADYQVDVESEHGTTVYVFEDWQLDYFYSSEDLDGPSIAESKNKKKHLLYVRIPPDTRWIVVVMNRRNISFAVHWNVLRT